MAQGVVLYPKRKEKGLVKVAGNEVNSVINQITNEIIQEFSEIPNATNLDNIADGTNYKRVAASQLSSGVYINATTAVKGIAVFPTTDFGVSSGSVTIIEASATVKGKAVFPTTDFTVASGSVTIVEASSTVKGKAIFPTTDFAVASGSVTMVAASATVAGKIEVATVAETNTGTDATRAVSPDGLAGSNLGTKAIGVIAVDATTDLSVADGKAYVPIPAALNGMNLIRAQAIVITAGTTNATTIDIYNVTDSQDMLSGAISIASGATVGTVGTINATYDDVATNDVLRVDVTTMSTTAPKGLLIILEFQLP